MRQLSDARYTAGPAIISSVKRVNIEDLRENSWLEPWHAVSGGVEECELAKEVSPAHPLFGVEAAAIARHDDDVLFFLPSHQPCLAVVHLTYKRENSDVWPYTSFFETLADVEDLILADYIEYRLRWARQR